MGFERNDLARLVHTRPLPAHAKHRRHGRAVDVGVQKPDAVAQLRQRDGEVGGDRRLAHAALAGRHGHEVPHARRDLRRVFLRRVQHVEAEVDGRAVDQNVHRHVRAKRLVNDALDGVGHVAGERRAFAGHDDGERHRPCRVVHRQAFDKAEADDVVAGRRLFDLAEGVEDGFGREEHRAGGFLGQRPTRLPRSVESERVLLRGRRGIGLVVVGLGQFGQILQLLSAYDEQFRVQLGFNPNRNRVFDQNGDGVDETSADDPVSN